MGISLRPEHLKRYKDMALLLMKYGRADLVKQAGLDEAILDEDKEEKEVTSEINQLPDDLERLGPTYIKLGQFLSTRSDMLPAQYLEVLTRLQDKVETFPFDQVEKIITDELGIRLSKAFREFDPKPVGSASIGQVHKAILNDGRPVVVKIQRPSIREEIVKDLDAFGEVAEFLEKHTETGRLYMLEATLEEFRKSTLRELDYRNEAQNLKLMARNLEEFENIVVPLPVEDFSTSKIITMDYVRGKKVTSISPLRMLDIDGSALAEELFRAYMKQIILDGFYHSDPHPGNVFITDDNKIALLDLGMVGYVSGSLQRQLLQILMAIGDGRGDDVATYAIEIGNRNTNFDEKGFRRDVSELVSRQKSATMEQIEIGRIVLEITKLSGRNGIHVPNELTMLGKTLLNLDKVGTTLDPKFNPNASIKRNGDELMRRKLSQDAQSKKPYEVLLETKDFFENLPGRVNKIMDRLAGNKLKINVDAFDEIYLMNGFQKVANRITVGLIIAALIIGAALIMDIESGFTIFGYPGIAIILFVVAAATGLSLAFSIIFTDDPVHKKEE
jgi:predicted unusual protein kinase regulating ubiquinone biosynthesis (AarF/ABC1/UbiB family)